MGGLADIYNLSKFQDLVLENKYLYRRLFDNLAEPECIRRYSMEFIASGTGIDVPFPVVGNGLESSLQYNATGLPYFGSISENRSYGCKHYEFASNALERIGDSVIPWVLLANLPQTIVSFIYMSYNGIFTCMCANREWSQYAVKRAPLRVTFPSPTQHSTFFIQLPYKYSVPLFIASILLHWFTSQSIFLVRIAR